MVIILIILITISNLHWQTLLQTIILSVALSLTALYFEEVSFYFVVVVKGLAVSA